MGRKRTTADHNGSWAVEMGGGGISLHEAHESRSAPHLPTPLVPSPLGRLVPQLTNPGDTQQRFTAILRPKIQPLTFLRTIF